MQQRPHCVITGCAGFIGSHLTDRLLADGWSVQGIDDLTTGDVKNLASAKKYDRQFKFWQGDFSSMFALDMVRQTRPDVVFHLAAKARVGYSVDHPAESNKTNVQSTIQLLEACRGNVGRFVFSSSSSVYGGADSLPTHEFNPKSPKSPYALQKSVIEDYCRLFSDLYALDTVCLRYFNVFGPRAKGHGAYVTAVAAWVQAIKDGTPLRSDGDGTQSRDMCFVSNVVQANVLAARAQGPFNGRCFNVACGDRTTNNAVLQRFKELWPNLKIEHAPKRPGDVMHTQANIGRAREELGYGRDEPIVTFWDGLERTFDAEGVRP